VPPRPYTKAQSIGSIGVSPVQHRRNAGATEQKGGREAAFFAGLIEFPFRNPLPSFIKVNGGHVRPAMPIISPLKNIEKNLAID
jgi:hypothetical protein